MRRLVLLLTILATLPATASAATYGEVIRGTPGVVAHWPVDEATAPVTDVVSGLSGTPTPGYALLRPAGIDAGGSSLWLASNSVLRLGADERHNFAGDRSVEAWVAPASITNQRHVVSRGTATSGYHLYLDPGGIPTFRVNGTVVRGPALVAGGWHHVVGTLGGRTLTLYVNGRQAGPSVELPGAPLTTSRELWVGRYSNSTSTYYRYHGGLDELALYGRSLAAAEVAAHFAAGADTSTPSAVFTATPGPLSDRADGAFAFEGSKGGLTFVCTLDDQVAEPCDGTFSYDLLRDGAHTLAVTASDRWGTVATTTHTWTVALPAEEVAPPVTALVETPAALSNSARARFTFTGSKPRLTWACRLDGAAWAPCASGVTFTDLREGQHLLEIRATDRWGVVGEPRAFAWRIDLTAPETWVLAGKATRTDAGRAVLGSEPGARFECRSAEGAWGSCPASFTLPRVEVPGLLVVRAIDAAGNVDPSPAGVVLDPADTSGAIAFAGADAAFVVGGNRSIAELRCRLDDGPESACPWPLRLSGLGYGEHRLTVTDPALPGVVFPTITWTNPLPAPRVVGSQFPAVVQLGSRRRQASLATTRLPRLLFQSNSAGTARVVLRRGETPLRTWSAAVVQGSNLVRLPRAAWNRLRPGRYGLHVVVANGAGSSALTLRFDAVRGTRR